MTLDIQKGSYDRARIATLGMFIIDTFRFLDDEGNDLPIHKEDQIGGGGTYFIIGARHFLPPVQLAQVIDIEPSTFPPEMVATLKTYGEDMFWFRERQDGELTARGLNVYTGQGRDFSMLSKGVRIWPDDLVQSPTFCQQVMPCIIHTTCSPERAAIIVQQIDTIREKTSPDWSPGLIWEILPSDCIPEKMPAIAKLCPRLSVLSPNHTEAMAMFGMISSPYLSDHQVSAVYRTAESLKEVIEEVTKRLFGLVAGGGAVMVNGEWDRGVVVRCGALGCCVAAQRYMYAASEAESLGRKLTWIDAYWTKDVTPDFQDHIVDVTGGGNAFLGGLSAGWKLTNGDLLEAAYYATVSASYAIEQDGLPHLASNADGEEIWNGDQPLERLGKLKARRHV